MTTPILTYAEVGAALQSIGREMSKRDLCFAAALDGDSDIDIINRITGILTCSWERASEIFVAVRDNPIHYIEHINED